MKCGAILFIIIFIATLFAGAQTPTPEYVPKIRFITSDFPPFSYLDDHAKPAGFMNEIVAELKVELGNSGKKIAMEPKIEFYPWKRAYKTSTEERDVLMYPLGTVPVEREKFFIWVGPRLTRNIWIYALKKKADKLQLKDKAELKGKIVGVTRGYSWADLLVKLGAQTDETVDDKILILKLLGNRMPYMAIDEDVLHHLQGVIVKENPQYAKESFEKILRLSDMGERTFGISKGTSPVLVEAIKAAFQRLEEKGVIKKILKNYPYLDLAEPAKK